MSWTKETVEEAIRKVGARAATDLEFRQLCVSNIHAAIQQESGMEVPASFKIGVLDQSANHLNLILPPVVKEEGELLESELESVAGGSNFVYRDGVPSELIFLNPVMPTKISFSEGK